MLFLDSYLFIGTEGVSLRAQIIDNLTENLSICLGHCVQQVDCTRVALGLDGLDGFLRVRLIGNLKTARKLTGFRALYVHYCYLLGIFPKNRPPQSRKRMHFLLREDLLKLDAITAETRLLVGHRIDTAEQLFCYRDEVNGKNAVLTNERQQLYKLQRTAAVKSDPEKAAEVKAQIAALSKELAALRKEVVLCSSIAERSGVIQEKIKAVREDEQPERKEKCDRTEQQKTVR